MHNEAKFTLKIGDVSLPNEKKAILFPGISRDPLPPFRLNGGNLGLLLSEPIEPTITFLDGAGRYCETNSVEFILRKIDHFLGERNRHSLLAGAALHYGLDDIWTLINGRDVAEWSAS